MIKIAIIVALEAEFNLTLDLLQSPKYEADSLYVRGTIGNHEVLLMQSGIGKVNAASRLTTLIHLEHPDLVINSGVAGGLGKGIRQGDIVIGTEYAYHDVWCGAGEYGQVQGLPHHFSAGKRLIAAARTLKGDKVRFGLIATGDQFIDHIEQINAIKKLYPDAEACDMESTAFAQVCHLHDPEFLAFRIISDTPGMEADNLGQYTNFFAEAPNETFHLLTELIKAIQ